MHLKYIVRHFATIGESKKLYTCRLGMSVAYLEHRKFYNPLLKCTVPCEK